MPVEEVLVGSGVEYAAKILLRLAEQHDWADHLVNFFKKKHRILVLGSAGTGKTNFIESLTQDVRALDRLAHRTKHNEEHQLGIDGNPFVFIDTPGDIAFRDERMRAIKKAAATGITGVINVVSYGYHEGRANEDTATNDGKANIKFLEERRREEMDRLAEWTPLLVNTDTLSWVITLVTKADLWWNQKEEVLKHYRYEEGDYHKALGDVSKMNEGVSVYCSVMHKFFNRVPLAGTFDDYDRIRAHNELLEKIIDCTTRQN